MSRLKEARVRPKQHRLELKLDMDRESACFDPSSTSLLTHNALSSSVSKSKTSYAIGLVQLERQEGSGPAGGLRGSVRLIPLDTCLQLRPDFTQIDEDPNGPAGATAPAAAADDKQGGEVKAEESEAAMAAPLAQLQPVFKRAETEKELEARRSSHAYFQEQLEAEPWSEARLLPSDSAESVELRSQLFGLS